MKKQIIVFLSFLLLFGCQMEQISPQKADSHNKDENIAQLSKSEEVIKGLIRVKLNQSIGDNIRISNSTGVTRSSVSQIDSYLQKIEASSMNRVFPPAGKYEERTRKAGLHLWYDIKFDEEKALNTVLSEIKKISGVDIAEEVYKPTLPPLKVVPILSLLKTTPLNSFNDPMLSSQWHYKNSGTFPKSIAGADINLFNAWEIETGKNNVIVSVVDGGIDVNHQDLQKSIHVNLAELNGTAGVDDDNNGYIDDIYGYDFVENSADITPDDHGTHVAGTIAARNNNGIGVCGIAGGDGTGESGVRLIGCQVFIGKKSGNMAAAIKYGADNGAVISQNSWGHEGNGMNISIKEAINYFIKYAGCDNEGNQLPNSPMKGGVVIFAAGNDDKDALSYPAAYPLVVSVSGMAPDFKKSWYTNRGKWISMMAPGGDQFYPKGMVISTITNNKYGGMQGTSMACPHVSGIAALVVSKFGGPGFSNDNLKQKITTAFLPVNIDAINPQYKGRLGKGYIDAAKALAENQNKKPNDVIIEATTEDFTQIELKWKAVADEDDGTANIYKLYYSNSKELTAGNYETGTKIEIKGYSYNPGETVSYKMEKLTLNTQFYFALIAEDRWGLQSNPIFFAAKTKENFPPKLSLSSEEKIRITEKEMAELKVLVNEPEEQEWKFTLKGEQRGVTATKKEGAILLKFKVLAPIGDYKLTVRVSDSFNAFSEIEIPFEIYKNNPPKQIKDFTDLYIPVNKTNYSINLAEYFVDEEGHPISYEAYSLDPSISEIELTDGKLTIRPQKQGQTYIEIEAKDSYEAKFKTNIKLYVVKDELVYLLYPIPVTEILNIRLSDKVKKGRISVYTSTGRLVLKQDVDASTAEKLWIKLNLSKLSAGSYTLHVEANQKNYNKSFIKL